MADYNDTTVAIPTDSVTSFFGLDETTTVISSSGYNMSEPRVLAVTDPTLELMRVVCEVWVSLPLAILGIVGNILALIVLCHQKQRLTTNVLLQALAVADTCVLVSSILLRSLRYVGWDAYLEVYHYIFIALYPCVYFFRLADTWITVIMTIDRYIAVCHPLHAQRLCTMRRTYIAIISIVFLTLAFSMPRFFENRLIEKDSRVVGYMLTHLVQSRAYSLVYRIFLFFLVMYLIPMVVLIVLNILLMCTLRRAYGTRSRMLSNGSLYSRKGGCRVGQTASRGMTFIVATVVTVCVLCNVSAMAAHVLWGLQMCFPSIYYLGYYRRYLANISNVMITFNCAINFLVYCMFSRKFRSGLKQACRCNCLSRLTGGWRSEHRDSSGALSTSYSNLAAVSHRVSSKKQNLAILHMTSFEK